MPYYYLYINIVCGACPILVAILVIPSVVSTLHYCINIKFLYFPGTVPTRT